MFEYDVRADPEINEAGNFVDADVDQATAGNVFPPQIQFLHDRLQELVIAQIYSRSGGRTIFSTPLPSFPMNVCNISVTVPAGRSG